MIGVICRLADDRCPGALRPLFTVILSVARRPLPTLRHSSRPSRTRSVFVAARGKLKVELAIVRTRQDTLAALRPQVRWYAPRRS